MFTKSLDNKGVYTVDSVPLKDLTESVFISSKLNLNMVFSYYKVSKELEMRPDKISKSLYGSDEYAEIVMKHSIIDNPFAIEEGDILIAPSMTSVYNNIKDLNNYETEDSDRDVNAYDLVQNYHKYIDKSKLPSKTGSDLNDYLDISKDAADAYAAKNSSFNVSSTSSEIDEFGNPIYNGNMSDTATGIPGSGETMEANLANKGKSGIYIKDGRIYFGKNVSASTENLTDIEGSNKVDNDLVDCAKDGTTLGQFLNSIIKID